MINLSATNWESDFSVSFLSESLRFSQLSSFDFSLCEKVSRFSNY